MYKTFELNKKLTRTKAPQLGVSRISMSSFVSKIKLLYSFQRIVSSELELEVSLQVVTRGYLPFWSYPLGHLLWVDRLPHRSWWRYPRAFSSTRPSRQLTRHLIMSMNVSPCQYFLLSIKAPFKHWFFELSVLTLHYSKIFLLPSSLTLLILPLFIHLKIIFLTMDMSQILKTKISCNQMSNVEEVKAFRERAYSQIPSSDSSTSITSLRVFLYKEVVLGTNDFSSKRNIFVSALCNPSQEPWRSRKTPLKRKY